MSINKLTWLIVVGIFAIGVFYLSNWANKEADKIITGTEIYGNTVTGKKTIEMGNVFLDSKLPVTCSTEKGQKYTFDASLPISYDKSYIFFSRSKIIPSTCHTTHWEDYQEALKTDECATIGGDLDSEGICRTSEVNPLEPNVDYKG